MDRDKLVEALNKWTAVCSMTATQENHLSQALYSFSELGMLNDLSIDTELAIKIWTIVEAARLKEFPEEYRM